MNNTPCGCGLRCFESQLCSEELFEGYWASGSFDIQSAYLCGCVKVLNVKRRYSGQSSRGSHTRVYYVSNGAVSTRACKVAFLRIHGISNGRLDWAIRAHWKNSGSPSNDMRGHHIPANKTSETDVDLVKEHILPFLQYQLHYSRSWKPTQKTS